jgi:hypothetical protein
VSSAVYIIYYSRRAHPPRHPVVSMTNVSAAATGAAEDRGLIRHLQLQFAAEGFVVLPAAIPRPLLQRLRHACGPARELARTVRGPQAQRLQPVGQYDGLDQAPFVEYAHLPALRRAIAQLISGDVAAPPATPLPIGEGHGDTKVFGVLFEPRDSAYCTNWHRDWRDNIEGLDRRHWWSHFYDARCFNQINCALYDDECLWVVPGSHLRADTPAEMALFPDRPSPTPMFAEGDSIDGRHQRCLAYARSMPGAQMLRLRPGDLCL